MRNTEKVKSPLSIPIRILRTTGLLAVVLGILVYAVGPILFMLDPLKRMHHLKALAPPPSSLDTMTSPPLEANLKNHLIALAIDIGERAAYQTKAQARACDYIRREFEKMGYAARLVPYDGGGTTRYNVEAIAAGGLHPEKGLLIVSAHYDTAPGTPGADDNASGVAGVLEIARLLKDRPLQREVRFVAFGTEEPPAFGTPNMGSYRYARALRDSGANVAGLINLEMLGYYNPKKGSQLYPPFLHLFFPNHGNFICVVSNMPSRTFLTSVKKNWTAIPDLPLVTAALPKALSGVTMSDQLNFWNEGFPAVMVSDTSFFRNPHYHERTDTPDKLNYAKMAQVVRSVADVIEKMP
jgi:hypothetical protein